jgi:hypothetical protein
VVTGSDAPENGNGNGDETKPPVDWQQSPIPHPPAVPQDEAADTADLDETDLAMMRAGAQPEELPLTPEDDDVTLPWLEGVDDGDQYESTGGGQILALALLGLLVVGLIVGAIWWFSRANSSAEAPVADGSVIEAPDQPYKERPEDPGGMIAEGTGDTSFAVSEGQDQPAKLGHEGQGPAPRPGFEAVGKSGSGSETAGTGSAAGAAASGGVGVQVGAYSTRDAAEKGWSTLAGQNEALSGLKHRILEGQADIGKVFRLQAVAADAAAAKALCRKLKAGGTNCEVKN